LVNPDGCCGNDEEECKLNDGRQYQDELVDPIDRSRGTDTLEGLPSKQLPKTVLTLAALFKTHSKSFITLTILKDKKQERIKAATLKIKLAASAVILGFQ
jgi:hypothetical protein